MPKKSNTTQVQEFAEALKAIAVNVTARDRELAVTEVGLSYETISRYMNGQVRNTDKAADLITFFKARIEERSQVIA